ncbi:restriction endonuclease subunit S [Aliarcobacter butzleri]|uniref:restriction endonuclease subunit S n=1 Tax=Aliarcobacter butzleri TaxID=28197 RepID=UPI00214B6414|nr:restriction endonuclease subunit S [Aliarcobacter butzleri]MCP3649182.1 restriction endonuclease subunit S [Arcobacter sp. DNRA7]MCR1815356.1 restriction endonuclease subunit S [Aliarcobacter butzleri]
MSKNINVPKLRFKEFCGEWEEKIVGDIGKVSMCKRILKDQTTTEGEVPFYKIGTFGKDADAYISKEIFEEFKIKYSFPNVGDILISASGTIGRTVIYDGSPAYFQDSNIVWIANNEKLVNNKFLFYCYSNIRWNTENTTIARLYNENLRNIPFSIPSKKEQEKIALFLSCVDTKIEQLIKKNELLQQYKKSIIQKIFSQDIRFKDNDGSAFPEWEEKRLSDIGEIITGKTPSTTNNNLWNGDIEFVTPTDICDNKKYQSKTLRTVKKQNNMKVLPIGSIVYTCIASIGKMSLTSLLSITNQQINSIIINDFYNNEYIYYALRYITPYIQSTQANTTLPIINKTEFSKFKINIPCLEEQNKISNFLSLIDNKIEENQKQLEKSKEFKKSLLQQMFI